MSEDDTPARTSRPTRRALIGATTAGAAGLLAGCSSGGGGNDDTTGATATPTETGTGSQTTGGQTTTPEGVPHVSGQTLNWFMPANIPSVTWFGTGLTPRAQGKYVSSHFSMPVVMSMQNELRGPWLNNAMISGEVHSETYESVDITPGEITVKIRDDANWSNGDPVTAGDALGVHLGFRLVDPVPLDEFYDGPPVFNMVISDYEIVSDKEFKLISGHEQFDYFTKRAILQDMCSRAYWGGVDANVKQAPYDDWFAALEDWWDMTKNGEIDPFGDDSGWSIWTKSKEVCFEDYGWSEENPEGYDYHWEKHYRNPDNVATTGAWTLKQINGTKNIVLEPNEHHYAADEVNFDEIKLHARGGDRANRAAMNAGIQDYYRGNVPEHIAESFPDAISARAVPAGGGLAFGPNHRYKLFDDVKARQAIMHIVDTQRLVRSVHQTKYDGVTVPGGHGHRTPDIVGQDWIDQNLTTYERDLERAAELMREAGFTQTSGNWVDADGNALSVEIPTPSDTPTLEPTFASQLKQFGIDASIQTYSGGVFSEKKDNGEFNIFGTNAGVGYAKSVGQVWWNMAFRERWHEWYGAFDDETIEQVQNQEQGNTPENWAPLTIEAPPVGEPDGELQEWSPVSLAHRVHFMSTLEDFTDALKQSAWLYNWYMPVFPFANGQSQHFMDTAHWNWPAEDSSEWEGVGVSQYQPEDLISYGGYFQANPENPEDGATVED